MGLYGYFASITGFFGVVGILSLSSRVNFESREGLQDIFLQLSGSALFTAICFEVWAFGLKPKPVPAPLECLESKSKKTALFEPQSKTDLERFFLQKCFKFKLQLGLVVAQL